MIAHWPLPPNICLNCFSQLAVSFDKTIFCNKKIGIKSQPQYSYKLYSYKKKCVYSFYIFIVYWIMFCMINFYDWNCNVKCQDSQKFILWNAICNMFFIYFTSHMVKVSMASRAIREHDVKLMLRKMKISKNRYYNLLIPFFSTFSPILVVLGQKLEKKIDF